MNRAPKSISVGGQYAIKKKTQELGGSFLCSNFNIKPLPARGVDGISNQTNKSMG